MIGAMVHVIGHQIQINYLAHIVAVEARKSEYDGPLIPKQKEAGKPGINHPTSIFQVFGPHCRHTSAYVSHLSKLQRKLSSGPASCRGSYRQHPEKQAHLRFSQKIWSPSLVG